MTQYYWKKFKNFVRTSKHWIDITAGW